MAIDIQNGQVLAGSDFEQRPVIIRGGRIISSETSQADLILDATGLMVLPGIIDIHGDAFERQLEPRPGVHFPLPLALAETDRQLVANGITTACHAVTCSWEPGLRSVDNARNLLGGLDQLGNALSADHRFHLRHEIFNLDAEPLILDWIASGRLTALAFNDHMDDIERNISRQSTKLGRMIERTGLLPSDYMKLVERVTARRAEVPASVARIGEAAEIAGLPILSHDDRDLADRAFYREIGGRIAEFPKTVEVARNAIEAGEHVVFGAPNVVRGGSQNKGCPDAHEMVAGGLCSILASDYFYPAMRQAVVTLVRNQTLTLAQAWSLISANPAAALGLADRGTIEPGKRADLILAQVTDLGIEIVATIVHGELVYLTDAHLISAAAERDLPARRVA